jgi:hypothetical protein
MGLSLDKDKFKLSIWDYESIKEIDFLINAQSGDILLFRSNNALANIQRMFTNGDVDHAALIVRINDEIYIADASGGKGVAFLSWLHFKMTNEVYD